MKKAWELEYYYPEVYFSEDTARNYEKSSRMKRVQEAMTEHAVALLREHGLSKGRILDAGCGTGFSTMVLEREGYDVVGVDVAEPMLKIARQKGLSVVKADMRSLPFPDSSFDGIVCISALQWVTGKTREEVIENYSRIAGEFHRVLRRNGLVVLQFYPKTREEEKIVLREFEKKGFRA